MSELEKIGARYSKALDAKPGKGPVTRFDALVDSVADIPFLLDLIAAVRALHRSKALPYTRTEDQTCAHCGHPWPCPTTQALDGAA